MDSTLTIRIEQSRLSDELLEPNAQTLQAIYELESNINTARYHSVEELKVDLFK